VLPGSRQFGFTEAQLGANPDPGRLVEPKCCPAVPAGAQDRDLVPEHQDLRILGGVIPRQKHQPAECPDDEQVREADEHERRA
jgi:hypothetical protein